MYLEKSTSKHITQPITGLVRSPQSMVAVLISCLLFSCSSASEHGTTPPSIIFIMADDLGYADISPYGQSKINTPNLDRMAAEGMLFTQFYAGTSVCAPSRAVLMTGLHTGHVEIREISSMVIEKASSH